MDPPVGGRKKKVPLANRALLERAASGTFASESADTGVSADSSSRTALLLPASAIVPCPPVQQPPPRPLSQPANGSGQQLVAGPRPESAGSKPEVPPHHSASAPALEGPPRCVAQSHPHLSRVFVSVHSPPVLPRCTTHIYAKHRISRRAAVASHWSHIHQLRQPRCAGNSLSRHVLLPLTRSHAGPSSSSSTAASSRG